MKRFFYVLLFLFIASAAGAQTLAGYNFKVKIRGVSDTTLLLAHHYGDQQYVIDTVRINNKGEAVFASKDTLIGGIYLVVMPSLKNKFFEFVVSGKEPAFAMETDTADFVKHMKITGSEENKIFYEDLNFINEKRNEMNSLKEKLKAAGDTSAEGKQLKEEMKGLNKAVEEERQKIMQDHPDLFYTEFLKCVTDIKIPDAPLNPDGTKDSTFAIRYIRNHYFDNINFNDERLLRTNMYDTRIKKYIRDYVPKTPDSLDAAVDFIISKSMVNKYTFQFITVMLLNEYATSKIMGFDAVYVHIVDTYYATGKAFWLDDVGLYRIQAQAERVRPTLIGKQAPFLTLQDSSGHDIPLYAINKRFTVIIFWTPDCGHCKKEMPKIEKLYPELQKLDAEVYAVYSEEEPDKWKAWLHDHKYPWVNVYSAKGKENFQVKYNVDQTPMIYILDRDKKIIGKKIGVDQIMDILQHQIEVENGK